MWLVVPSVESQFPNFSQWMKSAFSGNSKPKVTAQKEQEPDSSAKGGGHLEIGQGSQKYIHLSCLRKWQRTVWLGHVTD